ncbi:MAG TPA: glycosyltransferase [Planctomycetaceae bacterium]|nr:glycosyltransferase [Planctomycetaceae bacterium]
MEVVQVNAQDTAGGAERVMRSLDSALRQRGIGSQILVGRKLTDLDGVTEITDHSFSKHWSDFWSWAHQATSRRKWSGISGISLAMKKLAYPTALIGRETFHFPSSHKLLSLCRRSPDLLHLHNLHGNYFDLRFLAPLSQQIPVVMTLHDAWLLSGHCAHGVSCDRWKTGCGQCPDLAIYPAIQRDGTRYNWNRKATIYAKSKLHVVTPCRWLMNRVEQSMLWPGIVSAEVIHNGVDLDIFRPMSKVECRRQLGIPDDVKVLMFAANGIRANPFKDFATLRAALAEIGRNGSSRILALAIGDTPETEQIGSVELRFVRFQDSPETMAQYYNASDVYVHVARVDTFPNSVLEAMACGLPVVASAVGGIPEQVISLEGFGATGGASKEVATGILVQPEMPDLLSAAVTRLLGDTQLRATLSRNTRVFAVKHFGLERQANRYLNYYRRILKQNEADKTPATDGLLHG